MGPYTAKRVCMKVLGLEWNSNKRLAKAILERTGEGGGTPGKNESITIIHRFASTVDQSIVDEVIKETGERFAAKARKKMNSIKVNGNGFLRSDAWRHIRYQALLKYGRICQCCGATPGKGVVLHVDHVKPRSIFPELALELSNLQILCDDCNIGKGAWDQTDFREEANPEAKPPAKVEKEKKRAWLVRA